MPVIISVLYSALFRVQVLELKQQKKNIKSREIKEEHKIYLQLNFFFHWICDRFFIFY